MTRFSEKVMDHFQSPRNQGRIESPHRVGLAGVPGRGRYVALQVRLDASRVSQVRFESHGCGTTIASASALTELMLDQTLEECGRIGADDVLQALDGLPPDKQHCAKFVVAALHDLLRDGSKVYAHQVGERIPTASNPPRTRLVPD